MIQTKTEETLQDASVKIKKKSRNTKVGERNYTCGGCQRAYKSYPALYLHIKRKHDGIRPLNTKTSKPLSPMSRDKIHTGRPQKPSHDVDGVDESQIYIENTQSELLGLMGERLKMVSTMDAKPKLENIAGLIVGVTDDQNNDMMVEFKKGVEDCYADLVGNGNGAVEVELDFDTFLHMDREDPLRILAWFMLWLGKYIVKPEAIRDLTIVFSKIWGVLRDKQLQIQDLDNKLVWNGVMKECDTFIASFVWFEKKKDMLNEFVSKTCHLIGKIFE